MAKIFVNGTFDLIHRGHLEMLRYAKSLSQGSLLIVAIDSDDRVKELKGPGRPINNQADRKFMLESIKWVDHCWTFGNAEELEYIIKLCSPDIMVKGSDYKDKHIVGAQYCKEIVFYDHTGHSTTDIIRRITNR